MITDPKIPSKGSNILMSIMFKVNIKYREIMNNNSWFGALTNTLLQFITGVIIGNSRTIQLVVRSILGSATLPPNRHITHSNYLTN